MKNLSQRRQSLGWTGLFFLLAILVSARPASAQLQPPMIFFTDLDSGPNSGGENVNGFSGAYVTLYGNFFGAPQGSSTLTWNGLNCLRVVPAVGSYSGWGSPYFWYQKIVVQLGSGCTPGAGSFVVTVNGKASNAMPFTVRSNGTQYFVSTSGNDNNSGSSTNPFATLPKCKNAMKAGDVCYVKDGASATVVDNYSAALELETSGTAGNPIAFVAYPGASVTIGNSNLSYGLRVPNINISVSYITIAGFSFTQTQEAMDASGDGPSDPSTNWRVIANSFQCPTADGQEGCFTTHEQAFMQFLGNETTNTGKVAASKQQHADYFSSDTNHVVAAWNYIHDNRSCRAIQFHSSPLNGGGANDPTGHNQFDLSVHDNLIHDDPCDGINFATVDPSQGKVEAYNNVIYHVGIGPSPEDGDSGDYSCIYMAYITNTGPVGGGTVELYNNTLYDCGGFSTNLGINGSFNIGGGEPTLLARIRNNVMYQLGVEPFGAGGGWDLSFVSGSNNVMFSTGSPGLPSFLTGTLNSDPLFLDLVLSNLHARTGSPAIDAGITINSGNTYNNYAPWNGTPEDHDGVLRPQGAAYDIGGYEFFTGSDQRPNAPTNVSLSAH